MNKTYPSDSVIREFLRTKDYDVAIVITPALYAWQRPSGYLSFSRGGVEFGWFSLELFAKPDATAADLFNDGMKMYQEIVEDPEVFFAMYEHQETFVP